MGLPPLPNPSPARGEGLSGTDFSPPAGKEGARTRQRVGRRGGKHDLLTLAKRMRREPTEAEHKLWSILRSHQLAGWKFKRQEQLGDYIVDFVCFRARLIVEVDGGQHCENPKDQARDKWLGAQGFRVVRFWNNEVLQNKEGVAAALIAALHPPLPNPSPARGEGLNKSSPLAGEDSGAGPRSGLAQLGEGT